MKHFIQRYGPERLLFGSDFPFGNPGNELRYSLGMSDADLEKVVSGNILRLLAEAAKTMGEVMRREA